MNGRNDLFCKVFTSHRYDELQEQINVWLSANPCNIVNVQTSAHLGYIYVLLFYHN